VSATGYVRTPTIADDRIVFACEDDLWAVGLEGGIARRLTATEGECTLPRLSPDGTRIAFVGRDEGNPELYVMPAEGGVPRRLTHLGSDVVACCGWSRDGRFIHFTSDAGSPFVKETLAFRVDPDGGEPVELGIGHAMTFDVAANGATLLGRNAIDPARWKRYRGGTAGHLWVDARGDGEYGRICRTLEGNLVWPLWLGERVLFLSDHDGIGNLFSVDAHGGDLRRHTDERVHYARFPSGDGTRVVYACGGDLVLLDPRDGSVRRVPVQMPSNAWETARRFVDASELLETWAPSHDGTALGIVSRGRAYTMPLWEEAVTEHPATGPEEGSEPEPARRRLLTWMHDDKRVAYVDDFGGYERIAVAPVDQSAAPRYATRADAGVLHQLVASPAGDRLAFANNRHELWLLDLGGEPRLLDRSVGERIDDLAFSPDGRWLAYVWSPRAHTAIVRLAECETGRVVDATSALREDRSPAWDPEGNYLYFISTRDFHPVYDALQFELSFPEASRPYLLTLRRDVANPFVAKPAPLHKRHDDDDDDDDEQDGKKTPKPEVVVEPDGLPLRMLAFPVDEGAYDRIAGVKGRAVFSRFPVHGIQPDAHDHDDADGELFAYDFEQQRGATLAMRYAERKHLPVFPEDAVDLRERHAGLDTDELILRHVLDYVVESHRAHDGVERARRIAELQFRTASDEREGLSLRVQCAHRRGELIEIARGYDVTRRDAGDRRVAHPRPASPVVSLACGTYLPGRSPHRRGVGNILSGLNILSGSNAVRIACIVSRSSSLNCSPR